MQKADYSRATPEERENVIKILQRNLNLLIEQRRVKDPERQRQMVSRLCDRIRNGEVITGSDYKKLVRLFQKKPIGE